MTENNFNFTNGVSYDVWYEQKRLIDQLKEENKELIADNIKYLKALAEIERICVYLQERPIYAESIIPTYLKPIKIQDDFEDKILDIISRTKEEGNNAG